MVAAEMKRVHNNEDEDDDDNGGIRFQYKSSS